MRKTDEHDQHEDHMDELIREAVRLKMERIPEPRLSSKEAWEQFQQRRKEHQLKEKAAFPAATKKFPLRRLLLPVTAVIMVFAFLFSSSNSGDAGNMITQMIHTIQDSVTSVFIGSDDADLGNEQDGANSGSSVNIPLSENLPVDEAVTKVPFPIWIPNNVPELYVLEDATLIYLDDSIVRSITLNYESSNESFFQVTQRQYDEQFGTGETINTIDTEEITISGKNIMFYEFPNNETMSFWIDQGLYIEMYGTLSKDQVIGLLTSN